MSTDEEQQTRNRKRRTTAALITRMPEKDREILIRLDEKVDAIKQEVDSVKTKIDNMSNGSGFPRCAKHETRIEAAEKDVAVLHTRIDKIKTAGYAVLGPVLLYIIYKVLDGIVKQ